MENRIQAIANTFSLNTKKEYLVEKIYFALVAQGANVWIVNDRYIGAADGTYVLTKNSKAGRWNIQKY